MIERIPVPVPADWSDPLLVISQPHFPDPEFAIAAVRAGALGLVTLALWAVFVLRPASSARP